MWQTVTTALRRHPPWRTVTAATAARPGRHAGGADPLSCTTRRHPPPRPCPASRPAPFCAGGVQGARREQADAVPRGRRTESEERATEHRTSGTLPQEAREPAAAERRPVGTSLSLPHVAALIRATVPPMHPGGRPLVAAVAGMAALVRVATGRGAVAGLLATAATALFFRNPRRVRPPLTGVVLAAADGTVSGVSDVLPPAELDLPREQAPRVSVFLSVLDVHVQRVPVDGRVVDVVYRPGTFLSADLDKASEDNERNSVLLHTPEGHNVVVVQIAGLIARRIVCQVGELQFKTFHRLSTALQAGRFAGLLR